MKVIELGSTRTVTICRDMVIKNCRPENKDENRKEYDNYCKYKDENVVIVNKILGFYNNIITAERCLMIDEYLESNNIKNHFINHLYMNDIFIEFYPELGKKLNYEEKRDYIIKHTDLSTEEITLPDNWGINQSGELVLIDYSR